MACAILGFVCGIILTVNAYPMMGWAMNEIDQFQLLLLAVLAMVLALPEE